jgi:DNA repair exonuclease SbcCD nuclease subunit
MLRIAHTADVHWRGLSRHDEYREIFSSFINDCKKNRVDHIFVGGDIFHTKTSGISPEYINQLTWWLNAMSQVSIVHIVLGNHDGNLTNLSRQDAVSPIVDAMKNDRIKLYKKSGIYEFSPGYNWCVFSLFDEEGWKDVKPVPGMINIACFHGSVRGCVTETGWDVS